MITENISIDDYRTDVLEDIKGRIVYGLSFSYDEDKNGIRYTGMEGCPISHFDKKTNMATYY